MDRDTLLRNPHFRDFVQEIQQELEQLLPATPHHEDALRREVVDLELQCRGWLQSLGNPSLSSVTRAALDTQFEQAQARIGAIQTELARAGVRSEQQRAAVDLELVADALLNLDSILSGENVAAGNIMLSQHIDGIFCDEDGEVQVRTCKLGAFAGVLDLLPRMESIDPAPQGFDGSAYPVTPRRRGRLDSGAAFDDEDAGAAASDFAVDPKRFGGLEPEWFTVDILQLPRRVSWAETYAREVAQYRLETHASMLVTSRHFEKSIPTIRNALRFARERYGMDAFGKGVSRATLPNWVRDNMHFVEEFFSQPGAKMKDAVIHFRRSDTLINMARALARSRRKGCDT